MGSRHVAWLMLGAIQTGCAEDVLVTLNQLDKFIPAGSTTCEYERRDLLHGLGEEVIACSRKDEISEGAWSVYRALLEHLAGPDRAPVRVQ